MNILHITYIYPPKPYVADGITNVVYNVTRELAKKGHQVTVFTSNLSDLHSYRSLPTGHFIINDVNVFYFRCLWKYKTFMFTPSMIQILKNENSFDIIHIHDARSFQAISTYLLQKTKDIPYAFQPHGSYLSLSDLPKQYHVETLRLIIDKVISQRVVRNASRIIALNRFEAEQYRAMGVPEEKIAIIPNGIDLSEYTNLPPKGSFKSKHNIPEDKKIILYLGRIHKIKGIDFLIKAYAYLVKKIGCKDTILVIAGPDDGYLNEAKALVKSLKIDDSVMFTGPLYGRDKLEAYVDSEVYVLPSRYETFPMTVLEAYACGKPVIASNVSGLKELIVEGETGFLFKVGDVEQLAAKMLYILRNEDITVKIGLAGRSFVKENFEIGKTIAMLERIYESIVANNPLTTK
ncbi:MAG: glycosyltransferase family 4 protein [Nitrososphaerota archaeon]